MGLRYGAMRPILRVLTVSLTLGLCCPAVAAASAPIEEVWSFNGGEIAVQPGPAGTLVGTVVQATSFARCSHPVGETMWTDMRIQADGSYWGLHQWFAELPECVRVPVLGPTAWRVMPAADGSEYLLVCFSRPGGPQPTIAPSGASANVTYACVASSPTAPVPVQPPAGGESGPAGFAQMPAPASGEKCFRSRSLRIHLKHPKYDPLREAVITVGRRKLRVRRHGKRFASTIVLRHLPTGTFKITIQATTVLGHHLSSSRTYHSCAATAPGGKTHAKKADRG